MEFCRLDWVSPPYLDDDRRHDRHVGDGGQEGGDRDFGYPGHGTRRAFRQDVSGIGLRGGPRPTEGADRETRLSHRRQVLPLHPVPRGMHRRDGPFPGRRAV